MRTTTSSPRSPSSMAAALPAPAAAPAPAGPAAGRAAAPTAGKATGPGPCPLKNLKASPRNAEEDQDGCIYWASASWVPERSTGELHEGVSEQREIGRAS